MGIKCVNIDGHIGAQAENGTDFGGICFITGILPEVVAGSE